MMRLRRRSQRADAEADDTLYLLKLSCEQGLNQAEKYLWFNLFGSAIGYLTLIGGIVAMFTGHLAAAVFSTAAGIIFKFLAFYFNKQTNDANKRVDAIRRELLEKQRTIRLEQHEKEILERAIDLLSTIHDETQRDNLTEAIIRFKLGLIANPETPAPAPVPQLNEEPKKLSSSE